MDIISPNMAVSDPPVCLVSPLSVSDFSDDDVSVSVMAPLIHHEGRTALTCRVGDFHCPSIDEVNYQIDLFERQRLEFNEMQLKYKSNEAEWDRKKFLVSLAGRLKKMGITMAESLAFRTSPPVTSTSWLGSEMDSQQYELCHDENGLSVWKKDFGNDRVIVRSEFLVPLTPKQYCEYASNIEFRQEWDSNVSEARKIEQIADGIDIAYIAIHPIATVYPRDYINIRVVNELKLFGRPPKHKKNRKPSSYLKSKLTDNGVEDQGADQLEQKYDGDEVKPNGLRNGGGQNDRGEQNEKQGGEQNEKQGGEQNKKQGGEQNEKQGGEQNEKQGGEQNKKQGGEQNKKQVGEQNEKQGGEQNGKQGGEQNEKQGGEQNEKQGGEQNKKQGGEQYEKEGEENETNSLKINPEKIIGASDDHHRHHHHHHHHHHHRTKPTQGRVGREGCYASCSCSIEHPDIPEQTGKVRADVKLACYLAQSIYLPNRINDDIESTLVWSRVYMFSEIDPRGWIPNRMCKYLATRVLPATVHRIVTCMLDHYQVPWRTELVYDTELKIWKECENALEYCYLKYLFSIYGKHDF